MDILWVIWEAQCHKQLLPADVFFNIQQINIVDGTQPINIVDGLRFWGYHIRTNYTPMVNQAYHGTKPQIPHDIFRDATMLRIGMMRW